MPSGARPVSTLHVTESRTTIHAQQCVHATPHSLANDPDVVVVALAGSPATWLDQWNRVAGDDTRTTFVVDASADWIAGHPRDRIASVSDPETDVRVETVTSTGNLTDLGVTLLEALEPHRASDSPTALCFQSLTVLLQWSAVDDVSQFLHTLLGHLDDTDTTGHFHLHERAHAADTVDQLRPLFDRVRRDPA